jgi:hypothetical protein
MKKCKYCKKVLDFELFCSPECAMLYKKTKDGEKKAEKEAVAKKTNINTTTKNSSSGCGCGK